jgi:hypothetical protein
MGHDDASLSIRTGNRIWSLVHGAKSHFEIHDQCYLLASHFVLTSGLTEVETVRKNTTVFEEKLFFYFKLIDLYYK